ncbi:MAG: pantothenate kinase, partial [Phototrophicales bacterium]
IVFGVYNQNTWQHLWRIQTVHNRMPDEYAVLFQSLLGRDGGLELAQFDKAIVSSVVPQLTYNIVQMIERRINGKVLLLTHDLDLGIQIDTDTPNRVGADLLADSVAAYTRFQDDCIVVDFGTATTFTTVTKPGVMRGTAIAAGLNVTIDALVRHTAQLPQIELVPPPSIIGRNTVHAMQAGLVVGYVAMVEGLIHRIKAEIGTSSIKVIATGGLSGIVANLTNVFDVVDPWLTLEGLRLIAARNM